jgi:hypothetical protein
VNILFVIFPSPKGPVTMFHCLKALTISQKSSIENGIAEWLSFSITIFAAANKK